MPHYVETLILGPYRYTSGHHLGLLLALFLVIGAALLEGVISYMLFMATVETFIYLPALFSFALRLLHVDGEPTPLVCLELTVPADMAKSAFATEQLHVLMHHPVRPRRLLDRLAGRKRPHSLEIVSSLHDGIRYLMVVPAPEVEYVTRQLQAYLPGIITKQVKDYSTILTLSSLSVTELRLTADYLLSLQNQSELTEHDPISYLTGQMTKLGNDEVVALQIVTVPILPRTHHRIMRHVSRMRNRVEQKFDVSSHLAPQQLGPHYFLYPPFWFVAAVTRPLLWTLDLFEMMVLSHPETARLLQPLHTSDDISNSDMREQIRPKVAGPLFEVSIRLLVSSPSENIRSERLEALLASFQTYASAHQSLAQAGTLPLLASPAVLFSRFRSRLLAPHLLTQQTVLSAAELSSLYHIPDPASQPEDLLAQRHPDLPAPLSVKQLDGQFDVILGRGSDGQPVGLTLEQRQKHTYLIGKTGMGKTTLLMHSIVQDMVSGKGLCVLDPHGDMFHELLGLVPPHRLKDVVVFDPADREWPVSLNLLDPGIDFASMDEQEDRITSAVIAVFARLAEENQWGPRMEHVLRNATMTALQQPNPSLFTLQRILTDSKFQKQALKYVHDPVLLQFWQKEWKRNGDMQLASMTAPLTHRLGHFITAKMSRNILLQGESTIRIGDIMNEGKILLVNLSKGELGEDQSRFFGTLLTAFIWLAAYQRTTIPEAKRRDFFLYVDEFQNFATPDFASIVSEGRKYHLSLVVSHQSISQIKDKDLVR